MRYAGLPAGMWLLPYPDGSGYEARFSTCSPYCDCGYKKKAQQVRL